MQGERRRPPLKLFVKSKFTTVFFKGTTLKDDSWDALKTKLKSGIMFLMMGSKEEDIPIVPVTKPQFIEDMDESELHTAMKLPAGLQSLNTTWVNSSVINNTSFLGLTNLGNTCYLNATVQCLKTVPEFCVALREFEGSLVGSLDAVDQSLTAALRDLYK